MAHELLFELHQRGIKLRLADDRLDVIAPAAALTPQLREQLKQRRDELIGLLRQQSETGEREREIVPTPQDRYEPFPLTDIQHAYWVGRSSAVELGGVSCHWYEELASEGLDVDRLNSSLRRTIARHDMLRAIVTPDGQQRILREVPDYTIAVHDLRGLGPDEQRARIAQVRAEMSHQVLPADTWPLFAFQACRLDDARLLLHVSLDLLILDGLSLELFFADWRRFYEEPDWDPAPLTLSYRDYVLAERAARDGASYARAEKYWSQRLTELPPAPALPLARQPGQLPQATFTRRRATVPRERWAAVKQTARQRGLTPSAVLMTAFADVLALWSKQPGFTLNLTLFNRPPGHPEIGQVIGDFTSVTLLDASSQPDESFTVRAERLHQQLMRDLAHSAYSGVRVLRERARRLGAGPAAAMPVVFTSALMVAGGQEHASSMRFFGRHEYGLSQTPQVWLDHQVLEDRGDLVFNWDSPEGLFPEGLLDDMFAGYRRLLDLLADDPDAWDAKEALVGLPQWQRQLRTRVNDTTSDIPARTLPGLVAEAAARHPDAVAVIAANGQLTYRELMSYADRLAQALAARDARRDPLVGVVLEKGWEQPAAVLGVTRAGAAYLPIDPGWPAARRHHLLRQGGVRTVVTTARLREELSWPDGVRTLTFDDDEVRAAASPGPAGSPLVEPSPEDLAYVIFTSGSTGQPKGVMIDHRGAANTIQDINRRFQVGPADRVLGLSALTFDLSVYDVFGVLAAGGTLVLPSPAHLHDPAHWTELVRRHGVTIWNSVPALMQAWVDSPATRDGDGAADSPAAGGAGGDRSGLRAALLSGDWIPVTLPDAVRALHPDVELLSLGGATEASIWSVSYPIGEVPPEWSSIPYGKPLANQTLHIYDERLEPCPVWTVGEIYIGGVGVAKGYWADPEKTADRFVVHPRTGERLYRTGDLGRYLPDGDIEFLGREDAQVKLNGYRIELGEITAALRRQPGVGDALVTVSTNPRTQRRQLVAHIVPAATAATADGAAADSAAADVPGLDLAWPELVGAGEAELRRRADELTPALASYAVMWRTIERIAPIVMARTLTRLGFFGAPGDTASVDDILGRAGVRPMYRGLVRQWLRMLAGEGLLCATDRPDEYRCEPGFDAADLDRRIRSDIDAIGAEGVDRVAADYFISCTEKQVELLRGEVNPVRLLLPDGGGQVTEVIYATNPVNRLQNLTAARLARTIVEQAPAGRRVRILEVGAGTGATTAQMLPALPADRVSYRFTDISTFFTTRAKRAFADYDFVEYGLFNIDDDPATHGLAPGSIDLVIGANVLHDAKDLNRTLRNLRGVLAPGGVLMLIEGTVNSPLHMLSVAFLEGYANFQDQRELPLLSVPEWGEYLTEAGFTRFTPVPGDGAVTDVMIQHILLAQAPGGATGLDPAVLRGALTGLLPDYMVPHHYLLIDEVPLSANGKVDTSALPSPWDELAGGEQAAPRDDTERRLFEIWRETLGRDDFGVDDNFFELGGDSLHAVHILGRMRDELGMRQTPEEGLQILFDAPTIAELSRVLDSQPAAG